MTGAEDLLWELEQEQPALVRLAEAVSLAIRVDPPLLRRMRLTLVPEADAGTEADLWRSILVKSHGPEGFVFYGEIAEALRERLAKSGRLAVCWENTESLHLHLSPAIRLEEEIAALSVSEKPEADARIEELLRSALAALVVEERRGLANWAARALPALPAKSRKFLEARMLAEGAQLRLRGDVRTSQADEELSDWLPWLAPTDLPRVHVGVRMFRNVIELDAQPDSAGQELLLPQADPLQVDLSWADPESRERHSFQVTLRRGEIERIALPFHQVQIRTMLGEVYNLRPSAQRVFLGSTARDLGAHRQAVFRAISSLDGFLCVRMEDFGSRDWEADAFCRARVKECEIFLALVGHFYGSSPQGSDISFMEREFNAAVEVGIPRLLFLATDDMLLPSSLREPEKKWKRQQRFRKLLRQERIVSFFDQPDRLADQVIAALRNLEREGNHASKEASVSNGGVVDWSSSVDSTVMPVQDAQPRPVQKTTPGDTPAKSPAIRRVFLSSTARDLGPHREAVVQAVYRLDGFQCVRMEDFGPRDWEADAFCEEVVRSCDVFLGLVGHLYGSSSKGKKISFTEREYDAAVAAGVPRLLFLAADDFLLSPTLREPETKWRRQERFRERLKKEQIVAIFDSPDALATRVVVALRHLEQDLVEGQASGEETAVQVEGSGVESATLQTAYLSRLYRETALLSLAGIDPASASGDGDAGLSLDAVFTALLTLSPRGDRRMPAAPDGEQRPLSALEQLNRHSHLVLLGDPGSGKSTFVSFVALCLAGEALGPPHAGLDLLRAPLPDRRGHDEKKPQPWDHGPLLPVRVVLRDFAVQGLPNPGERATADHLWKFIAGGLEEASLSGCADFVYKHLQEKGGLILLDGFDEVPETEKRREQIRQAVEDFVKGFSKCRVLLTSRTYAYQSQGWKLKGFAEAVLAPFSDGQIHRFVARWYAHSAAVGKLTRADAEGKAEHLRQAIFEREQLRELAGSPLLLTLMACLHAWRGADLPEKREELYAATVDLLLDRWESRQVIRDRATGKPVVLQPSLTQYLEMGKDKVRQVLEELAFDVHTTQGDRPGTADVAEGDLVARLMRLRRTPETNPAILVDYLSQRAGLLVSRGVGMYAFPHRTFQEYLAACHLAVEDFPTRVAELGRSQPELWREVVLLAGAKAARGTPAPAWQLAHELCYREPQDPDCGPADAWGAHLAGQMSVEAVDLSRKISEPNRRQLDLLRRWHVHLLRTDLIPARERALAGKTLAKLGDPRFDPDRWFLLNEPLLGFVEVPAGLFQIGEGKEQHELALPKFLISRFPITVQQFRAFVAHSGHEAHPRVLEEPGNHPVTAVSWHDALAYCEWLTERLKEIPGDMAGGQLKATMPSEAEWEKAARGTDGREYPWGSVSNPERANYNDARIGEPSTIGCFSGGCSPYGCEEMSGNVWEWTRSLWGKENKSTFDYPYDPSDGREDLEASGFRGLRGGAFSGDATLVRCAGRHSVDPTTRNRDIGFRVVLRPFFPGL